MKRIIVTLRTGDWHACLEGDPTTWVAHVDVDQAVRMLIRRACLSKCEVVLNPPLVDTAGVAIAWATDDTGWQKGEEVAS